MYSPRIPEQLVPRLWRLAQERKVPMTHLVRDAVVQYLNTQATHEGGKDCGEVNQDHGDGEGDDPRR